MITFIYIYIYIFHFGLSSPDNRACLNRVSENGFESLSIEYWYGQIVFSGNQNV